MRKVAWKLMTGAALLATPFAAQAQTAQASGEGQSAEAGRLAEKIGRQHRRHHARRGEIKIGQAEGQFQRRGVEAGNMGDEVIAEIDFDLAVGVEFDAGHAELGGDAVENVSNRGHGRIFLMLGSNGGRPGAAAEAAA